MTKIRGFEQVNEKSLKNDSKTILPTRSDNRSAGYDFYSKETQTIQPGEKHLFWTDVKSFMQPDEFLAIHVRSSIGIKAGLMLANTTGIIDSSYYENKSNDGNIGICLYNNSDFPVVVKKDDRIAQGIFTKYLTVDNEEVLNIERKGGIGSSGK